MTQRLSLLFLLLACATASPSQAALTPEQQLGKLLYRDKNLSLNKNQSCNSCHSLNFTGGEQAPGFIDPENFKKGTPVSSGSIPFAAGLLNAPSVGYAAYSPDFHYDADEGLYVGGQFWNGRSIDLIEQAKQPFLNPREMAMPNAAAVVGRLLKRKLYQRLFERVYDLDLRDKALIGSSEGINQIYDALAKAIAAFEKTRRFNKFNSKFDYFLAGKTELAPIERQGLELFNGKAGCSACHISEPSIALDGNTVPPLFTDFTYDNIGLPRNVNIPGNPEPDLGLGGRADIAAVDPNGEQIGKHKVMSLRNIELTPPYGHNGVLKTLEEVVHFYNTRDTLGSVADNNDSQFGKNGWPEPEVPVNMNADELGNLGLSQEEEKAIVAFLKTLTDNYPSGRNRK